MEISCGVTLTITREGNVMISLTGAVQLVVYLVVAGLVFWLLWWLLNYLAPPEPFRKVGTVILVVLAVLVCIGLLLRLVGAGPVIVL